MLHLPLRSQSLAIIGRVTARYQAHGHIGMKLIGTATTWHAVGTLHAIGTDKRRDHDEYQQRVSVGGSNEFYF